MTRRKRLTLILTTIPLLLMAALVWGYTSRWTVERADKIIKEEAPLGSSVESVSAMLTKYNFAYSPHIEGLDSGNTGDKAVKLKETAKGYMAAIKKDVEWSLSFRWDIAIKFYFNERGELIDYTVRKVGTGP
jgi:hypothetical protein